MDKYVVVRGRIEIEETFGAFGDSFKAPERHYFFVKDDAALAAAIESKCIREDDWIVEIKSLQKAVSITLKLVDVEKKEATA